MKYKEQFIRFLSATVRSTGILILGSLILYFSLSFLFSGKEYIYYVLGLPVVFITLFTMVALIVSEILKAGTFNDSSALLQYSRREMFSLFGRSFLVVGGGLVLGLLFWYVQDTTETEPVIEYSFYISDFFLTMYALGNIVKGEKLREVNLRRIQSENALLKTQLNPHFLYNTLNNIDALIWYAPEKASEALLRLSYMMRYMTYGASHKEVPVKEEVNYISEFIALQRMRFDNPEVICFETEIDPDAPDIAPMLLIPFVENAFKHATDKQTPEAIIIRMKASPHLFELETINEADSSKSIQKEKEGGVGLKLVKKRLALLYSGCYELTTEKKNNQYRVSLKIHFIKKSI